MRMILGTLAGMVVLVGCQSDGPSTTVELDPVQVQMQDYQGTFDYMADSALLADMTLSDYHFVPHRPVLTPLGEQRLRRLAALIDAYGGEIRFNTDGRDPVLAAQRATAATDFLREQGVDTTSEVLTEALAGSRGIEAEEAILIRKNEGSYQPGASGPGAGLGGAPTIGQ